ncbi:hypothetical protein WPS_06150 [Vulcanimicrobium alpinum]|uniref:Uncharacterized protein n=1 Tax=Vulcanimicrobium alpinum TaxID=3016050 RepID=A0AAN2C8J0_UNVUL|nr:hypothetical protein [Vulcanimicrobium alpinum]BDE05339.1 hypothetical protein WPS_06150 [Vulcanimicrobium alpinum]
MARRHDPDDPVELHSPVPEPPPLSRAEADVAGITTTPEVIYADTDEDENRDDIADSHRAEPDEHF